MNKNAYNETQLILNKYKIVEYLENESQIELPIEIYKTPAKLRKVSSLIKLECADGEDANVVSIEEYNDAVIYLQVIINYTFHRYNLLKNALNK